MAKIRERRSGLYLSQNLEMVQQRVGASDLTIFYIFQLQHEQQLRQQMLYQEYHNRNNEITQQYEKEIQQLKVKYIPQAMPVFSVLRVIFRIKTCLGLPRQVCVPSFFLFRRGVGQRQMNIIGVNKRNPGPPATTGIRQ